VRKVGRVPDLAFGISDGLGRLCFGIGLWPCVSIFCAVAVFRLLALGRVSDRVRQCVALACGRAWPGQTCALAKNKAPNFRSFHEAKELVSII